MKVIFRKSKRWALPVGVLLLMAVLAGCTFENYRTGNRPLQADVTKIKVNESTKEEVLEELGSPSSVSPFNPDIWYYISQTRGRRTALQDSIDEQMTLALSFNEQGILSGAEVYGLNRAVAVAPDRNSTPTKGRQPSFFSQLLGGLTRPRLPGG